MKNLTNLLSTFAFRNAPSSPMKGTLLSTCLSCDAELVRDPLFEAYQICPSCRFHHSSSARQRIEQLTDPESFKESHRSIVSLDPLSFSSHISYRKRLFDDQRRTGLTEAIVTGSCTIDGLKMMLIILDFSFLGGSMGCVVGEKIALAFEQAATKRLPVVAVVSSGGSRIQEGALSLMQMAKTATAATYLRRKGLPFISILTNPSSGQAYASFANLADIILAEPAALVGFAPLRVARESSSEPISALAHTAEAHLEHGLLDAIVDRETLRAEITKILTLLQPQTLLTIRRKDNSRPFSEPVAQAAWNSVQIARHQDRPSARYYIGRVFSSFVELHGDRSGSDDSAIVGGLASIGGQGTVVIGQENTKENGLPTPLGPDGLRKSQRFLNLASKFGLPVITFIDTPGAATNIASEEKGLGHTIANTMATMAELPVPIISVLIGQGGSEAALAMGVADKVLMLEHAIYAPISPEAGATLLYRDVSKAPEVADSLRLTSHDCRELRIVDRIISEPKGGAHNYPEEAARNVERAVLSELGALQGVKSSILIARRYKKFRKMGEYSSHFRAAIGREVDHLQGSVMRGIQQWRKSRARSR